nr:MAG TPA: hypothetical protein [Caudoviricetes sp.]
MLHLFSHLPSYLQSRQLDRCCFFEYLNFSSQNSKIILATSY